jgi:hypothetical protein
MKNLYLTYGNKSFGYNTVNNFFTAEDDWIVWQSKNLIEVIRHTIKFYLYQRNKK